MSFLITATWFQVIGVTIVSAVIGVFVKYVSRNDTHDTFVKEDLAIGLDLYVTSLIILITSMVDKFGKILDPTIQEALRLQLKGSIQSLPWLVLTLVIGLWGTSTVVRKIGWETKDSLNIKWGIMFPNAIGITALIIVFLLIKN